MLVIVADAIDKERGCPVDAALHSGLEILKDTARVDVLSQVVVESREIEPQPCGVTPEAVLRRRTAASVDPQVHIPKPALRAGSLDGFRCDRRRRMGIGDREMTHYQDQFIAQALTNADQNPQRRLTRGAFEVRVLDQL